MEANLSRMAEVISVGQAERTWDIAVAQIVDLKAREVTTIVQKHNPNRVAIDCA